MSLSTDQLRSAFGKLNGKRDVRVVFENAEPCRVTSALLVPEESDNIVKLTDGKREFLLDVEHIAWVEIE